MIQLADQAIACQDSVKVKQFATRTQKMSGLFNQVFTIVYGLTFDKYLAPLLGSSLTPSGEQPLNLAVTNLIQTYKDQNDGTTSHVECFTLGKNLGLLLSEALEAKTESIVQFVEVQKFTGNSQWFMFIIRKREGEELTS